MQRYYETVIDTLTGAAVANAEVWTFNSDGNTLATTHLDAAGTNPAPNPLITDSNGYFEFYAADGLYTFEYRSAGLTLRTVENVAIFDLPVMRADVDAALAALPLKASIVYADAGDAANAAAIAALDAATYSKAEVDALIAGAGGGGGEWGTITGVLADQADLETALTDLATSIGLKLAKASNLSDLASIATSRTNLSVYSKAETDALIAGVGSGAAALEVTPTKPLAANFTLINGGVATGVTMVNKSYGILLDRDVTADGALSMAKSNTAPGATFTLTARMAPANALYGTGYCSALILRNSTSGRVIVFGSYNYDSNFLAQNWSTLAVFTGNLFITTLYGNSALFPWRRITLAAGTLTFWMSCDGETWASVGTTTAAAFINAAGGSIDQVGFGALASQAGTICHSFTLV